MGCQMLFDNFLLLFSSELNDTVVEAQLRTRQVPPPLPNREAIQRYLRANNRLLILVGGWECPMLILCIRYLDVVTVKHRKASAHKITSPRTVSILIGLGSNTSILGSGCF